MVESTIGWFGVREKYYSLADKSWLINQIRQSEQAVSLCVSPYYTDYFYNCLLFFSKADHTANNLYLDQAAS